MTTDTLFGESDPQPKKEGGSNSPTFNKALSSALERNGVVFIQEDFCGPNMPSQQEVGKDTDM